MLTIILPMLSGGEEEGEGEGSREWSGGRRRREGGRRGREGDWNEARGLVGSEEFMFICFLPSRFPRI